MKKELNKTVQFDLSSKQITKRDMNKISGGQDGGYKDGYGSKDNPVELGDVVVYPK